jgi:hypothetical protein
LAPSVRPAGIALSILTPGVIGFSQRAMKPALHGMHVVTLNSAEAYGACADAALTVAATNMHAQANLKCLMAYSFYV